MSRSTAPALMWRYFGKNSLDRVTKRARICQKETRKEFRIMFRQWRQNHNGSKLWSLSHVISNNVKQSRRIQNGCRVKGDNNAFSGKELQHSRISTRNTRWERPLSSLINLTLLSDKLPFSWKEARHPSPERTSFSWVNHIFFSEKLPTFVTWDHATLIKMCSLIVSRPHTFRFRISRAIRK